MIFGTDSDPLPCDESIEEDRESSQSAAVSSKKRSVPESNQRVRLSVAQKMEAVKHFEANPGMTYPKLVDWCYKKYEMKKKLSASTPIPQ